MSLLPILIFAAAASLQHCLVTSQDCPNIVSRSEWGARAPKDSTYMYTPVDNFVVHHTAGSTCDDLDSCSGIVRSIQNYHMDDNDWWDIGYNFLIGGDGNVYEGRGWDTQGAHAGVTEYNTNGLGVSMMGDFTSTMPTDIALRALDHLLDCAIAKGKLADHTYTVLGHRDVKATLCPGDMFYSQYVTKMPNYNLGISGVAKAVRNL